MTVPENDRVAGPYAGNGTDTTFGYDFDIVLNTDLVVILRDTETDVETVQTISTHYSVNLELQEVTMVTAPTEDEEIVIVGAEPLEQATTFELDVVNMSTLQEAIDRAIRQLQQVNEIALRAPAFSRFSALSNVGIQTPGASTDGYALTWDNDSASWVLAAAFTAEVDTITAFGASLLDDINSAAGRTTLGLALDTDVPSQATYAAHVADADAHGHVVMLEDRVTLVNRAAGSDVSWTASDITAYTGSDVARHAILSVYLSIEQTAGPSAARQVEVRFRETGTTPTSPQEVRCAISSVITGAAAVVNQDTIIVPLDGDESFDYEVDQDESITTNIQQVYLVGYIT